MVMVVDPCGDQKSPGTRQKTLRALKAKMPVLDWGKFKEETDNVEGAQMLACVSGVCEI